MKTCSKCKLNKELSFFNYKRQGRDGFSAQCKGCSRIQNLNYYYNNKVKIIEQQKLYYTENKAQIAITHQKYQIDYVKNNTQKIAKQRLIRQKSRIKTDINFKLAKTLRTRLKCAIRDDVKVGSAIDDLGCSIEELRKYLEDRFYRDNKTEQMMSWKNHGLHGWHIDHIIPLSLFDLTNREQFFKACHYTNLQPLWAKDNISKSNKVPIS